VSRVGVVWSVLWCLHMVFSVYPPHSTLHTREHVPDVQHPTHSSTSTLQHCTHFTLPSQPLTPSCKDERRKQRGAIVNIASLAGQVGIPNSAAYVASKHAVMGLAKSATIEYAGKGIRINCVAPGWIDTPVRKVISGTFALT
jgi:NAD(P)-dependent dehydrogenase (short-subunit alcohol dehydrogenase family)